MTTIGIICEYNPFHNGHAAQIRKIRAEYGQDCAVVCLMSGNYVQRGEPAIFPKTVRAESALLCGADLVLELPLTAAVCSAEGFADGGVRILDKLGCGVLSFGAECGEAEILLDTARLLLKPELDERIRLHLGSGCSYPAARELALRDLGGGEAVTRPNDILAVEYCKAVLRLGSGMRLMAVPRPGDYHAETIDPDNPSATALRAALARGDAQWETAVPSTLRGLYASASVHTLAAGERANLARLRTLSDADFAALPFGSEGLWSKFMKNCRACASVEEILAATKSKRYTLSRIRRMLLCAFLGLTASDLEREPPYVRVLGFNDRGREVLRQRKDRFPLINAGQTPVDASYYALETRASDLYGLFRSGVPEAPGAESRLRVVYQKGSAADQ